MLFGNKNCLVQKPFSLVIEACPLSSVYCLRHSRGVVFSRRTLGLYHGSSTNKLGKMLYEIQLSQI